MAIIRPQIIFGSRFYLLDQPLDPLERGEVLSDGRRDGVPHGADSDRLYVHERLRVLDGIVDNLGKR